MTDTPQNPQLPQTPKFSQAPTSICTYLTCANNHRWVPDLALPRCPGCHAPLLALRLSNCPICNEPSVSLTLRVDHTSRSIPIASVCTGASTAAEVFTITLPLQASQTAQSMPPPNDQAAKVLKAYAVLKKEADNA